MLRPPLKLALTALRYVGVAILFALCGAWSSRSFMEAKSTEGNGIDIVIALQIPFALLCAALFMRTAWAILVVPLMSVVWLAAYAAAFLVGRDDGSGYVIRRAWAASSGVSDWRYLFLPATGGCSPALTYSSPLCWAAQPRFPSTPA